MNRNRLCIGVIAVLTLILGITLTLCSGEVNIPEFVTGVANTLFGSILAVIYWTVSPVIQNQVDDPSARRTAQQNPEHVVKEIIVVREYAALGRLSYPCHHFGDPPTPH